MQSFFVRPMGTRHPAMPVRGCHVGLFASSRENTLPGHAMQGWLTRPDDPPDHWRTGTEGYFGNSIIAELERHRFYQQLLLNKWLREDLGQGRFGIGAYANLRVNLERLLEEKK